MLRAPQGSAWGYARAPYAYETGGTPLGWEELAKAGGICANQLQGLVDLIDNLPEGAAIRGTLTDLELAQALIDDPEVSVFNLADQFNLFPGPGCDPAALAKHKKGLAAKVLAAGPLRVAPGQWGSPERPLLKMKTAVERAAADKEQKRAEEEGTGDLAKILPWALGGVALFLLLR